MPYYAISGSPKQIQKASGGFASGYYLKFYASGTNTPIFTAFNTTATDDLGSPLTVDKIKVNTSGWPVNPSGGAIVPHLEESYKIVLYKNAADADADNTNAADWVVDGLSPGLISFTAASGANAAGSISYLAAATASTTTVEAALQEHLSVKNFGATGDGTTDDSTYIDTALQAGLNIYFPEGTYLCSGVKITTDYLSCHFAAGVTLKAVANDNVLFEQVASYSRHTGTFSTDDNGKTGVIGMQIGPDDLGETTELSNQIDNRMPGIISDPALQETVIFQCGPFNVTASENYGNTIPSIDINGCRRGVWFKDPVASSGYSPHSNTIYNIRGDGINVGVDIQCGYDNSFYDVRLDNASSGSSPHTTATAIRVESSASNSVANDRNKFFGGYIKSSVRDIYNNSDTTEFHGLEYDYSNSAWSKVPYLNKRSTYFTHTWLNADNNLSSTNAEGECLYSYNGDSVVWSSYCYLRRNNATAGAALVLQMPFSVASRHIGSEHQFDATGFTGASHALTDYFGTSLAVTSYSLRCYFSAANEITIFPFVTGALDWNGVIIGTKIMERA